jgi:hypothetical protein
LADFFLDLSTIDFVFQWIYKLRPIDVPLYKKEKQHSTHALEDRHPLSSSEDGSLAQPGLVRLACALVISVMQGNRSLHFLKKRSGQLAGDGSVSGIDRRARGDLE